MMKVAVIGSQGVPASYGGFESLVENLLGENCPKDVRYTVFCSAKDMNAGLKSYKGAELKYVNLHADGMQSIPYDMISMCKVFRGYDVILILGVSGCMFLPFLRMATKARIIVNIDGLEHRRDKWGKAARWVLRTSEAMAVRYADTVVADNKGIQNYVRETYGKPSELIAYGGDHAKRTVDTAKMTSILSEYGLRPNEYAITVCRVEPENNSHVILEAFSRSQRPLVFVGNWEHSEYSKALRQKYGSFPNIHILDAIYDLDILYTLRSNAGIYMHGHSAGGTNPSLVEAMHFGIPVVAYDVVYNRETTEGKAYYFKDTESLRHLIERDDLDGSAMSEIANRRYTWKHISDQYCRLYRGTGFATR